MRTNYGDLPIEVIGRRAKRVDQKRQGVAMDPGPQFASKLERAYANYLAGLRMGGIIAAYWYEPLKLRLADRTWYTPDFLVLAGDGLTFYEVKGFMRDDAAVKLKVAAAHCPWADFILVTRQRGEWVEKRIPPKGGPP